MISSPEKVYDVTIIGSGPAGLFTAFYAGMRQMSVKIIESLPTVGGQLSALYPEKYIYDVAGFPKIRAQQLIDNLMEQLNLFDYSMCLNETVEVVDRMEDSSFKLTSNKTTHYTKTIIITAGNGAFQPRRFDVEGSEVFEEKNLHYYVDNMNKYNDKNVLVLGGGDSAVDWALMMEPIAEQVSLVHRREQFRAHEHSVEKLKSSSVNVLTPYLPSKIDGTDKIEKVQLKKVKSEETLDLDVDYILCNYGFISKLGPIANWGLDIYRNSIVVNSKMETNIPGIYAAGDINTYPGKVKLIATGFGDGPTAINNAMTYLDPKARVQPKHSTSMF